MSYLVENNIYQGTPLLNAPIVTDPILEPRGVFSLNASNQLQATFWIIKNGSVVVNNLGAASYTIYDKDGSTVGITESGILADANAQYITTPVLATAIQDLTHYVAKVTINVDGSDHIAYLGITLGE